MIAQKNLVKDKIYIYHWMGRPQIIKFKYIDTSRSQFTEDQAIFEVIVGDEDGDIMKPRLTDIFDPDQIRNFKKRYFIGQTFKK